MGVCADGEHRTSTASSAEPAPVRAVNERIKELGEKVLEGVSEIDFACECDKLDCHSPITMEVAEFEAIDRLENRFIVRRGHEAPDVENVVGDHDSYVIVAMRDAAAEFVKER